MCIGGEKFAIKTNKKEMIRREASKKDKATQVTRLCKIGLFAIL